MYKVVEERLFDIHGKPYITYGIMSQKSEEYVPDVSLNKENIIRFVDLLNSEDVSPVHLMDVIEDFIYDESMSHVL